MPTYEYACAACKHEWEVEQRITAEPIKKCPSCGKSKARRLVGSGNFILKGGGWYSDLYSSPAPKKKATDAGDSKPAADKPAEKSADKPAADAPKKKAAKDSTD